MFSSLQQRQCVDSRVPGRRERLINFGTRSGPREAWRAVGVPAAAGPDPASTAQELLGQLSDTSAWSSLEPHFGTKIASQLLQRAESAVPSVKLPSVDLSHLQLPSPPAIPNVQMPNMQMPNMQVPNMQLPNVQMPNVQLPSVQLPGSLAEGEAMLQGVASSASGVADGLSHLPASVQQRLELVQLQLQDLASSSQTYEPHFGTRAFNAWLQEAAQTLSSALHVPMLQLPTAGSLTPTHLLLSGSSSSSSFGSSSSYSSGALLDTTATINALSASWQVLSATAYKALPAELSSTLSQSMGSLQQQSAAAAASLDSLQASLLQFQDLAQQLPERGVGGYDFPTLCFVAAGAIAAVAASVPSQESIPGGSDDLRDELSHDYDPASVAAYFRRRPVMVAQRSLQLAVEVAGFGLTLLGDMWTNRLQANEGARAVQLRGVIERLGPAYVKVAQALSTRVDLLSPEYYKQVQLLQDRVPPFPCDQAKEAMSKAFGRPVDEVFSVLSAKPVAAASLGQVYRGRLKPEFGGTEVAVKVQRPDVLEQVCLDLYLMRQAAEAVSKLPEVKTNWASLIDNWAVRFLHEMDYTREAANGQLFREQMAAAGVSGVVTADVLENFSNDVVLTTAWMDGEKLSESRASDVRELCNTLLSAYLIQLLDTGHLHADPHPGNLIRTTDGKICVLDFGLVTEVTPEQRIALVEYIAHLTTQDWENVARDLQTLGFIPADAGDPVAMGMAEPLGNILVQLSGGGGATKLNIDAVMSELESLGNTYPFSIPPFFALILRAFSVIEGIALAVDPDYAIVQECFPYMARRLLSDDDPRVRKALRDVLYGGRNRLNVERLIRLSDAFSAYTTAGLADDQQQQQLQLAAATSATTSTPVASSSRPVRAQPEPALSPAAKDALLVVFSKKGSYVQELLVEELVVAADAMSREALSETLRLVLGSAPVAVALSSLEALGPLRPLLLPFTTPLELLSRLAPAVALTQEDEEALGVVRGIFQLVQRLQLAGAGSSSAGYSPVGVADVGNAASGMVFSTTGQAGMSGAGAAAMGGAVGPRSAVAAAAEAVSDAATVASELRPLLPELLPGLAHTGELFVRAFVRRVAGRLADSLMLSSSSSSSSIGENEDAERALAMAALGFVSSAAGDDAVKAMGLPGSYKGLGGSGTVMPGTVFGTFGQHQKQGLGMGSNSGGFGGRVFGFNGGIGGAAGNGMPGQSSAGQLVTGLVAAPLLMMLTPLAVLNELQRRQQDRQ